MDDLLNRFLTNLGGRVDGPLFLRFLLQPAMAAFYGVRDGVADARNGRPAFAMALITQPGHRKRLLLEGIASVRRIITLGVVMDLLYQWIVFRWVYPTELVFVVLLLAFIPYVFVRGPANRLARMWLSRRSEAR